MIYKINSDCTNHLSHLDIIQWSTFISDNFQSSTCHLALSNQRYLPCTIEMIFLYELVMESEPKSILPAFLFINFSKV